MIGPAFLISAVSLLVVPPNSQPMSSSETLKPIAAIHDPAGATDDGLQLGSDQTRIDRAALAPITEHTASRIATLNKTLATKAPGFVGKTSRIKNVKCFVEVGETKPDGTTELHVQTRVQFDSGKQSTWAATPTANKELWHLKDGKCVLQRDAGMALFIF